MLGSRRHRIEIALLACASALSFFDRQVLSVLAPVILPDLGMTNVEYGHAASAFTLAYCVMFSVGGRLVDLAGARVGLGLAVAFWSAASMLHAAARSGAHLSVFRGLLGIGEGACFPAVARGVLECFPARDRALAMGIATTGASALGAVAAPPVTAWLAALVGWRGVFLTTGFIGAAWVLLWFLFYRAPGVGGLGPAAVDCSVPGNPPDPERPWALSFLLRRREVWGLILTRFLLDPVFYIYMFWIPQYLNQARGASLAEIGRLAWVPFFTLGVSSCLGGAVSDRLVRRGWEAARARKTVMGAAAFLTPVSILALYVPSSALAVVLLGGLMLAHGFWMTNYMTLTTDLFPASTVAGVVGLAGTAGGLSGFLANLLTGYVVEAAGFAPVFLLCGVLYPLGFAVISATIRKSSL